MTATTVTTADSLVVTLDPANGGGVRSMQRVICMAHERMGLHPHLAFARRGRWTRWSPSLRSGLVDGYASLSTGYLPTVEYLNYIVPALTIRKELRRFPVVQLVSGFHSASLVPILARRPFVSWIATPFADENSSRRAGTAPTFSIRLNYSLRDLNQWFERWSMRYPKVIFALSQYTAARLADVTGIDRGRFEILRCPVDTALFRPQGPRWTEGPSRYLLAVGRVEDSRKNFSSLVRAFAPLAARQPNLDLVIVGPMDRRDNVVARTAREMGLGARVHLPGAKGGDELAAIYRSAEAYSMTSRQEGLGIAVIEAQASGLPVVIMRCGGSDELIDQSEGKRDGWLVEQGDEDELSRVLMHVTSQPELRAAMGAAARRKAEAQHSYQVFTGRLIDAYRKTFPDAVAALAS
jgi:glycosyltransferase involved in cell wall biosynthesis